MKKIMNIWIILEPDKGRPTCVCRFLQDKEELWASWTPDRGHRHSNSAVYIEYLIPRILKGKCSGKSISDMVSSGGEEQGYRLDLIRGIIDGKYNHRMIKGTK